MYKETKTIRDAALRNQLSLFVASVSPTASLSPNKSSVLFVAIENYLPDACVFDFNTDMVLG